MLGLEVFVDFASQTDSVDEARVARLITVGEDVLRSLGEEQRHRVEEADPVAVFCETLMGLVSAGSVSLQKERQKPLSQVFGEQIGWESARS
jgi:hypothetical protein